MKDPKYKVEIEEMKKKGEKTVAKWKLARQAIIEHIGAEHLKEDAHGVINCPVCKTTDSLKFTYAGSYNGHVWAKCITENCVEFIE
jgi:hypothetical protein